jgi:hypothetical protein
MVNPDVSFAGSAKQTRRNSGIDSLERTRKQTLAKISDFNYRLGHHIYVLLVHNRYQDSPSDAVEASRALQDQVNEGRSI